MENLKKHLMKKSILLITSLMISLFSAPAIAQISEVRFGISNFDEEILDLGISAVNGRESSVAINAEIIFEEPEFLKWALTPQPYINATLNLEGETSFGGAGLMWRQSFNDKFYGDFSFGLAIHDGTNRVDQNNLSFFEILERADEEISFGSRILFRQQLTLGYRVTDDWSAEIFGEHLSNGQILGSVNEGVDILGVKASKRF